jgi:DNA polymerase-3 subunit beta
VSRLKISVNRPALAAVLGKMASIAPSKPTLDVLANVLLRAHGDSLTVAASDLQMTAWATMPAIIARPGEVTVGASRIREIIDGMRHEVIDVEELENHYVKVSAGKSVYESVGLGASDFPRLPALPSDWMPVFPAPLAKLIGRVIFAVSDDPHKTTLNGGSFDMAGALARLTTASSRGLATATVDLGKLTVPPEIVLPMRAMKEIERIAGDAAELKMAFTGRQVFVCRESFVFCAATTGHAFPAWERLIPKDRDIRITFDSEELRLSLRNVSRMSEGETTMGGGVRFEASGDECHLFAASAKAGKGSEVVPCLVEGPAVRISLPPKQVIETVASCLTEKITMDINGPNAPVTFRPVGAEDFTGIVMPMKEA